MGILKSSYHTGGIFMNTQKVSITIPKNLVILIDMISKQKGISRSRYISSVLQEKLGEEQNREIKEAYDRIFSDADIKKEQLQTANWFEGSGSSEGQEW
jgi:metal-responsive CopG/Arc/MetJ family transcriptional regulator